jgi:hypothetical protein
MVLQNIYIKKNPRSDHENAISISPFMDFFVTIVLLIFSHWSERCYDLFVDLVQDLS